MHTEDLINKFTRKDLYHKLKFEDWVQVMKIKEQHTEYKYWKSAFDLYNEISPRKINMGCAPCYNKAYYYIKTGIIVK